ncbi:MAG: MarR family winged helix-turn-helix transcriptional regulator [Gammaproteobacteria bacterium]|nr:MarR family winged helix-turn-helix transcriptional regulator [Gammaproteobacteria bacterium]
MSTSLDLNKFLPYRFNRMAHNVSNDIATIYTQRFGITKEQWRIIALLGQYGAMTAKQIADLTYMDKVKISRSVSGLAELEHISRQTSVVDKRAVLLDLSATGRELYESITPLMQAWEEELLARLTPTERQQLAIIVDKLDPVNED